MSRNIGVAQEKATAFKAQKRTTARCQSRMAGERVVSSEVSDVPIIVLTGSDEADKAPGLDLGADEVGRYFWSRRATDALAEG